MEKKKSLGLEVQHLPTKILVSDRAKQYKNDMRFDGGLLFCITCNEPVDHKRKHVIESHLKSEKHLKRKTKAESSQSSKRPKVQLTMTTACEATAAKQEVITVVLLQ